MKLLKPAPVFQQFDIVCNHCKAEMRVESADDLSLYSDPDPRDGGTSVVCRCLECKTMLYIDNSKVPAYIRTRLFAFR